MEAQKNPWHLEIEPAKLKLLLSEKVQKVVFEKADGTIREMVCTTNPDIVPWPDNPTEAEGRIPEKRNKDENLFSVWDVEKEGWRSFRFERLIKYGDPE